MKRITLLLFVCLALTVQAQDKSKPDSTATVNLAKVGERIKMWQDRIAQIDKDIANLTVEKQQLQGAIAGMQITVSDSTLTNRKARK